ncbi:hypothetical protein GGQ73_001610 [Rhizobium skierniewicense]|uniref:Uncharacterized protein n=1 Tax=Rhizobium skierniewicense TaxID=984260 RepID=A0A7W6CBX3_9HYPH|nr:hypothetical protein [Rhizobium skierniewicense]MBB3945675.1 hypothetical protein [Rhizobium skierniewicense]NTF32514.1 hypothetical protein [Rhizobium skierniewicense]
MIADAIQDFDGALHVQQSAAQIATMTAADERPVSVGLTDIRRIEKDGKLEFQLAATAEPSPSNPAPGS